MTAIEPARAKPRTIRRRKVSAAVREWLRGRDLAGLDLVRAQLALALAAEVDDPEAPRYARPRAAAELRALLAELEPPAAAPDERELARRLLEDVLR
jgi:hypothetical protein